MGKYGLDTRNQKCDTLAYIIKTFHENKPSMNWTWVSPNTQTKNEIDYLLTNKKHIFQDVDVLIQFSTGSDHRIVRRKIRINSKLESNKKFYTEKKNTSGPAHSK